MLTQGAIERIFNDQPIPLNVQIETSQKLLFLNEEECALHLCQIYDGKERRQIKIKSQYTFYLNQQQPIIQIIRLGYHNQNRCIDEYHTLQQVCFDYLNTQQLIPFNINQYFDQNLVRLYDLSKLQQFTNQLNQRINIKGKLRKKFYQGQGSNGNSFKITTLQDSLSNTEISVISFENDWYGDFELKLVQIEENQEWVFLNILTYKYVDELRYRIDKDTIFFPLTTVWTDYDQINFENLGRIFNIFGYIYKIINIQQTGYQEITIINFQKQKVKVIIKLPFAKDFQLEENTIVGFKRVKVIQKSNSHLALSFNDDSKLCKKTQVELPMINQNDFQPPHTELIKLKQKNYEEILQDNQNNQYYRIIAKVQSIELINLNNQYSLNIKLDKNLYVIVKKKNYIQRLLDVYKENLDEYLKSISKNQLQSKFEKAKNNLYDFVIRAIREEQELGYEMVKLYSRTSISTNDEIQKKVKTE